MVDGDSGTPADVRVLSRSDLEQVVRERTAELQNVMDTMADLLIKLDATGRIVLTNPAVEEVLGYEDLDGKRLDFLLASPAENEQLAEMLTQGEIVELLFTQGAVTDLEVLFETADGRTIPMKLSASVMQDDQKVSGIVCVAKDISQMKRREREAKLLNDVLRRVLRHNMRNTLMAIQLEAEQLGDADTATREEIQEAIIEGTDQLIQTSEKARSIARVVYELEEAVELDVVAIAEDVVESASREYEHAEIQRELHPESAEVIGHAGLESAVSNLVENAIVHNDGDPQVSITVDHDKAVTLAVSDNGPGIPESEIEVLQSREETALEHGSGAGLWLVDWVVDKSGGDLTFDRENGTTTVSIRLPPAGGSGHQH